MWTITDGINSIGGEQPGAAQRVDGAQPSRASSQAAAASHREAAQPQPTMATVAHGSRGSWRCEPRVTPRATSQHNICAARACERITEHVDTKTNKQIKPPPGRARSGRRYRRPVGVFRRRLDLQRSEGGRAERRPGVSPSLFGFGFGLYYRPGGCSPRPHHAACERACRCACVRACVWVWV